MENKVNLVDRAKEYAINKHESIKQTRSNGEPYWKHPERVVGLLVEAGITNEDILAAAWLHDVPEDCTETEESCDKEIENLAVLFNTEVANIVKQLTNWIPKGTKFKEKQRRLIEHATKMNDAARCVKLADRYDNLSGMETWEAYGRKRYANAALELLEALEPIPEQMSGLITRVYNLAKQVLAETDRNE